MSKVTDVVLCAHTEDRLAVFGISAIFRRVDVLGLDQHRVSSSLELVAEADGFGGTKHASHDVWAAAFNHLDLGQFLAAVARAGWVHPGDVAVTAWPQDEPMTVFRLPDPGLGTTRPSPFAEPQRSRDRFLAAISQHSAAMIAISGDTLYHVQVEVVCRLLDVVDQVADPVTAERIADAIAARYAAGEATVAALRAQAEHLLREWPADWADAR